MFYHEVEKGMACSTNLDVPWRHLGVLLGAEDRVIFKSFSKVEPGHGESILFLFDGWLNNTPLDAIAPDTASSVPNKIKSVRKGCLCYV